jgi:murein DD-endopeptidase MepM/ murein hydrolase activator NlpD
MVEPGDVHEGSAAADPLGVGSSPPSKSSGLYRPLPSVDMALLPHERRAARSRQVALTATAAVLVIGGGAVLLLQPYIAALRAGEPMPGLDWLKGERTAAGGPDPGEAEPGEPELAAAAPEAPPAPGALPEVSPEALGMERAVEADPAAEPAPDGTATEAPAEALAATTPSDPTGRQRIVKAFGRARGFRDALVKAGASGAEADELVTALQKVVDFTRGKPEHTLIFERDAQGKLAAFEYQASVTERYRAERKPTGKLEGRKIEVPIERKRIVAGGYVADSLGRALEARGLKSSAAGLFVEAFEGKLDFKRDARDGDSFRVIVEEELAFGQSLGYGRPIALQYAGSRKGELYAFWFETAPKIGDFYDETGRGMHGGWLRTPLRYDHVSSPFNLRRRHPILKRIMPHNGMDYAAAPGTTVWAAADGVVTFAGARGPNGNLVVLSHAGGHETFYAHLLRVARGITKGVKVKQRQPIGAVGSTGRSTGPHLHFSLKRHGRFIDPAKQLNGPGQLLSAAHMARFKQTVAQLKRELSRVTLAPAPPPVGDSATASEDFHEDTL